MIRYDLICESEHPFDGWFRDSQAFDEQKQAGQVVCPACGSVKVEKQLMTPGVPAKANSKDENKQTMVAGPQSEAQKQLVETMRKLRDHVVKNADDVGDKFAEEARRIHFRETEERSIYGKASLDEAKSLIDEGIEIAPLPRLPEDGN